MATDVAGQPPPELETAGGDAAGPLPERAILVHIGPHKTGTTTVQAAFHASRATLADQGVVYAGGGRRPIMAVLALRRARAKRAAVPDMRHWSSLVDEARSATGRVVMSNEALSDAAPKAIARLVSDLGPDRVHVVATLRPFASILPSQWQQFVQGGLTASFEDWLRDVIDPNQAAQRKVFWRRHRHDELIRRWADEVGAERVTVIVLDDDPLRLPRQFEAMLGLRDGTLLEHAAVRNRSFTLPEAEAIRAINQAFRTAGYPQALQTRLVGRGVALRMRRRRPEPTEPRIELPAWATEPVAAVAREIVSGLRESGVRIIGDVDRLATVPGPQPADAPPLAVAPPRVAADLAGAVAMAAVDTVTATGKRPSPFESEELDGISSARLVGALGRRVAGIPVTRWRSFRSGMSES